MKKYYCTIHQEYNLKGKANVIVTAAKTSATCHKEFLLVKSDKMHDCTCVNSHMLRVWMRFH